MDHLVDVTATRTGIVRRWWARLPEADKGILTASALIGLVVLVALVVALRLAA